MKSVTPLIAFLFICNADAQESSPRNPWKPAPLEISDALKQAKILSSKVLRPASATQGSITVEDIEPPAWPDPMAPTAQLPPPQLTLEELAARRAGQPTELRLFSPTLTIYDRGLSFIRFWTADRSTGYQEYGAWVKLDLSTIHGCGDLIVGRHRYCMMPSVQYARNRFASPGKVPALSAFAENSDILLVAGDDANQEAMEPLRALVGKFNVEGPRIREMAAAIKADHEGRAAWEKAHPETPRNVVIKHWVIESNLPPKKKTASFQGTARRSASE